VIGQCGWPHHHADPSTHTAGLTRHLQVQVHVSLDWLFVGQVGTLSGWLVTKFRLRADTASSLVLHASLTSHYPYFSLKVLSIFLYCR
jgi:hypothetical protein